MDHCLTAKQLLTIKRILAPYAGVITRVDLFGSRATGVCRPDSDIDLVLHGQLDERTIDRLWTLFHESNLPVAVDVMSYDLTTYRPLRAHMDEVRQPLFTQLDLKT